MGSGHHGRHDGDDGELKLVLALIGMLLLGVVGGREEVVLDRRGGCGGGGHVALDLVRVDELLGDILIEDGRGHMEEIGVTWIDHKALQHGFVVVSLVQGERWRWRRRGRVWRQLGRNLVRLLRDRSNGQVTSEWEGD